MYKTLLTHKELPNILKTICQASDFNSTAEEEYILKRDNSEYSDIETDEDNVASETRIHCTVM